MPERCCYASALSHLLARHRRRTGLPHWIVLDEAHGPIGNTRSGKSAFRPASSGYCLATYLPEHLTPGTAEHMDCHIARWIRDVHRDQLLADHLRRLEGRIAAGASVDTARAMIIDAIQRRYGLEPPHAP